MSLSEHASVPPSVSFLGSVPPYYYKTYYISTRRLWYTGLVYNVTQGSRRKMCKKHTSSTSLAASRCSFPHSHKGMLTFLLQKPLHLLYRWVNCMTVNYTVSWMHQQKVPGAKKHPNLTWQPPQSFSWNTGEGQAMSRHLYAPDLKETSQCPRLKALTQLWKLSQTAAFIKTSKDLVHAFLTCFQSLTRQHFKSGNRLKRRSEFLLLLHYYTLILILLFLFIHYFRVTNF